MINRVNEAIDQLKIDKKAERNNCNLSGGRLVLLHKLHSMFNYGKLFKYGRSSKGRSLMKDIVIEYIEQYPGSASHEVAKGLKIVSKHTSGRQKDYFSWCILRLLAREGKIEKRGIERDAKYYPNPPTPKIS